MKDRFEFDLTVWKADQRDGKPYLLIYATDTADDRHGDNCTLACLEGLQKQIQDGGIEILNSHHDAVGLGQAVDAHIVDAGQFDSRLQGERALLVDTVLDPNDPRAIKLFEKAQQSTPENPLVRFSIGGELNKANPRRVLWKAGGGRQLNDMILDHITACRPHKASNLRTHIAEAVFKTLEFDEAPPSDTVEMPGGDFVAEKVGGGSFPLADRGRAWASSAADKRLRVWAGAEEKPNAKYASAFMWHDAKASDQFGSYKLGFVDIVDGQAKAIPRAIFAIAAVLQGSRGGVNIPDSERAGVKAKVEAYYGKMRDAFKDEGIVPPWKKEKTMPDFFVDELRKLAFGDGVEKALSNAYFEGETGPAGKGESEHVHQFTARLNADGGTVIGMTQNWSAGERHSHMVDLMGEDDPMTSGPSRGFQHFHSLEMPTVRVLTQADYEKAVAALIAEDPNATVLQIDAADLEKAVPPEPASADVAEKKAKDEEPDEDDDEEEPETKEAMGFFKTIIQKLRHKEPPTPVVLLKQAADHITPETVAKDGFDAVVGGTIEVLHKVLGTAPADRDGMTMRAAKTLMVLEAAAKGTELPKEAVGALTEAFAKHTHPVTEPVEPAVADKACGGGGGGGRKMTPEKEAAAKKKAEVPEGEATVEKTKEEPPAETPVGAEDTPKPAPEGDGEAIEEGVPDMKKEELLQAMGEQTKQIVDGIVTGLTDAFRKEGLLPAKEEKGETPAPTAEAKETTPAAPATETPVSKEAAPAAPAQTETPTAPADAKKDGEVEALKQELETVNKTVEGLRETVTKLSNAPAAPRNIAGQDGPAAIPKAKKGVFSGALFRGDKATAKQ